MFSAAEGAESPVDEVARPGCMATGIAMAASAKSATAAALVLVAPVARAGLSVGCRWRLVSGVGWGGKSASSTTSVEGKTASVVLAVRVSAGGDSLAISTSKPACSARISTATVSLRRNFKAARGVDLGVQLQRCQLLSRLIGLQCIHHVLQVAFHDLQQLVQRQVDAVVG